MLKLIVVGKHYRALGIIIKIYLVVVAITMVSIRYYYYSLVLLVSGVSGRVLVKRESGNANGNDNIGSGKLNVLHSPEFP